MKHQTVKYLVIGWILSLFIAVVGFSQSRESDDFSYSLKLYEQEFYDLAAQQFIKFYNNYPQSEKADDAHYYAAVAFYKIKEYEKARAEFQALALEFPKSPFVGEAWFYAGDCAEKLKDYRDAVKAYESLRVLHPKDTRASLATLRAAIIYQKRIKDLPKAAQLFNVVIERYPESAEYFPALVKKAATHFQLGQINEARALLRKAFNVQQKPDSILAEAYFIRGQINNLTGLLNEAKMDFQKAIQLAPKSPIAVNATKALSKLLVQSKDYARAIKIIQEQINIIKDVKLKNELNYRLADVYFLAQKYNLAQKTYASIHFANDSLNFILKLKRALCYQKQNFISEAVALLTNLLQSKPFSNKLVYQKSVDFYINFLKQNRYYQQAASFIYRQLSKEKTNAKKVQLVNHLVQILSKKNQWVEIINISQPYILAPEPFPGKDDLIFYFALAKENIGEFKQADYYFNKIIHEFQASEYFNLAKKHVQFLEDFKIVDQESALTHLAELLSKSLQSSQKQNAVLLFELGKLYFHDLKNYDRAEQNFESALNAGMSRKGDLFYYLGKTYLKQFEYQNFHQKPDNNLLQLAHLNFKKAMENDSTCAYTDESAWLLVRTALTPDSQKIETEKKFIKALIQKYPNSPLKEEWLRTLAIDLAFDSSSINESIQYFQLLIKHYQQSSFYPQYLLNYARLLQSTNPNEAKSIYEQIVEGFMFSAEAAQAIVDLIDLEIAEGQYVKAIDLFKRYQSYFYYAKELENLKQKMGQIYVKAGQYEQAIAFYKNKINTPFLNDVILLSSFESKQIFNDIYFLADALNLNHQLNEAAHFYQLYLMVEPQGKYADQAHFKVAQIYQQLGKYYLAKENFKAVSKKDPQLFTQATIQAGNIYFIEGDYKSAIEFYAQALKSVKQPQLKGQLEQKYILSLIRNGQLAQAEKLIRQFKKHYKKQKNAQAQFYIELGNYQRLQKNFNKAINYFELVQKKYKKTDFVDDAEYFKALVLITQNKHKEALKILTKFPEKYPNSDQLPGVYNTLGTVYFRSEKYDNAITMFKKALEHCQACPLEANIMTNLIKVYSLTGFWDAAQAMARSYLKKFPEAKDRLDKKVIIARAYINLNQFQHAVDYLKSIKVEADAEREPEIQFYIGEALLRAGQYEDAIAEFVKIPLLSKKTKLQWEASALYYSGQCYEKLGRIDDAIRMYKEIIKRPGIDLVLKKDAEKRIKQIQ